MEADVKGITLGIMRKAQPLLNILYMNEIQNYIEHTKLQRYLTKQQSDTVEANWWL